MAAHKIISRGKEFDSGKWYFGWYCRYPFGRWPLKDAIIPADDAENGYHHFIEIDGSTVGQFTGETDLNGVQIFEGDIVDHATYNFPLVVKWDGCGFELWLDGTYIDRLDKYSAPNCAVIGNIHDNPGLL